MMRVLITGREGQVARALLERGAEFPRLELIAVGRPELDLAEPGSGAAAVRRIAPDVVINAAAYTAVDQAEDEPELANRINGEAPGELAAAAREIGAPIIHISTDYVFDGRKPQPYCEDDPVGPINAYGRSKLIGEELVRAAHPEHLILRTAWVYSPWGKNFVKTMLTLARTREEISVVNDQVGSPTSALDLADVLLSIAMVERPRGTLHYAGTEMMSWAEFARRIFSASAEFGGPSARVRTINSAVLEGKVVRPSNSRLDSTALKSRFADFLPSPATGLRPVVARILRAAAGQARARQEH
jgi:dTDP-4-dehydrorhamnose reductase